MSGEDEPTAALETFATRLFAFCLVDWAAAGCSLFPARVGGSVRPRPRRAVDGGGGGATGLWYTGGGETDAGGGVGGGGDGAAGGWTGALRAGGDGGGGGGGGGGAGARDSGLG